MAKIKLPALVLTACMVLLGCQQAPAPGTTTLPTTAPSVSTVNTTATTAPTTVPTTAPTVPPAPPKPQTVTGAYFTALDIRFSDFFVTTIAVTYTDTDLTATYTMDGNTYQNTYDYQGRLLRQRVDGDKYWTEEIRTYQDTIELPLSVTFTRKGYSSQILRTFDERGNTLTEAYTNSENDWNTTTYTYDDENRLLTESYVSAGGSDTLTEYTYAPHGDILTRHKYSKGLLTNKAEFTYNEQNHLTAEDTYFYNENGHVTSYSHSKFTLDDAGRILADYQTNSGGSWVRNEYTYDAAGNTLTQNYSDSGGYTSAATHTYDAAGNLITTVERNGADTYRYEYEYDAAGNLCNRTVTDPDGIISEIVTWLYDPSGKLLEETTAYADGSIETKHYTYDPQGNLLTYTAPSAQCTYTYGYTELSPEQAPLLDELMQTVFSEYLP